MPTSSAAYDFGQFRAEAELGYKKAKHDKFQIDGDSFDADGHTRTWSLMGNVLWNPSISDRFDAYLGGGAGWAWSRSTLATMRRRRTMPLPGSSSPASATRSATISSLA